MPTYLEAVRATRANHQLSDDLLLPGPATARQDHESTDRQEYNDYGRTKHPASPKVIGNGLASSSPRPKAVPSKLDIGKQKGFYDTKEVRTRVAKWQALDDSVEIGNARAAAPSPTGVAPKKRIVSDGHWKKAPAGAQGASNTPLETKIQNILIERGLYVPPGGKNPEGWVRKKLSPVKKSQDEPKAAMPSGSPTKKAIGSWASKVQSDADGRPLDDLPKPGPVQSTRKETRPNSADVLHSAKKVVSAQPESPTRKARSEEPRMSPAGGPNASRHAPSSSGTAHSSPKPTLSRMEAWLLQTDDPIAEDLDDDDGLPPSGRGVEHDGERRTLSKDRTIPGSNHKDTHNGSLELRRREARRSASKSGGEAGRHESRPREFGYAIQDDAVKDAGFAVQLAPVQPVADVSTFDSARVHTRNAASPRPEFKRTTTAHDDLLSVLSFPNDTKERTVDQEHPTKQRRTLEYANNDGVLRDVQAEEMQYLRELQVLIDGVVPVLLTKVFSGVNHDSAPKNASQARDAVVQMGIALERLQGAHKRLRADEVKRFISWARTIAPIYADYIDAWRLSFQGLVIDLAPAYSGNGAEVDGVQPAATSAEGKADVTFLLKRPLVRLKRLAKMLVALTDFERTPEAFDVAAKFGSLVDESRVKQDQERARLEDEAAVAIDTTRARDLGSLAPLRHVKITSGRNVRARDTFDLHMHHSSGQKLDCRVILLLRDTDGTRDDRGDVLICQLEDTAKWLLFPPAEMSCLSARQGDSDEQLVVTFRGGTASGQAWRESFTLTAKTQSTAEDWRGMLGSDPNEGYVTHNRSRSGDDHLRNRAAANPSGYPDNEAALTEIDVPLGEQSVLGVPSRPRDPRVEAWIHSGLENGDGSAAVTAPASLPSDHASSLTSATEYGQREAHDSRRRAPNNYAARARTTFKHFFSDLQIAMGPQPKTDFRVRSANTYGPSRSRPLPQQPRQATRHHEPVDDDRSSHTPSIASRPVSPNHVREQASAGRGRSQPPILRKQLSTIMSESAHSRTKSHVSDGDERPPAASQSEQPAVQTPTRPMTPQRYRNHPGRSASPSRSPSAAPRTPVQSSPKQSPSQSTPKPQLSPSTPKSNPRRRSSSPLKHEYLLDSPSEASSPRKVSFSDDNDSDSSVSSVEAPLEPKDGQNPTLDYPTRSRPGSTYSPQGVGTLTPSQSASQAGYRTVPRKHGNQNVNRTIASIFSWSNKGIWELLHPDECSVIVSPGLIEAFKITAAHSNHAAKDERPLIALELTPLVPLRQGTAIDISVRSPPTPNSLIRTSNNIMFRSRTGAECDILYQLINQARINNPTYIALQNARPTFNNNGGGWASIMDKQASQRGSGSWWRLGSKKSTYRASSRHKTLSVAETSSETAGSNSMSSPPMSALKRFTTGSKVFNVAKSTITSSAGLNSHGHRHSRNSNSKSTWTSSSGGTGGTNGKGNSGPDFSSGPSSGSGYATPGMGTDPSKGSPAGMTDMKIRFYERESASKWRDMGRARLTILHPPRPAGGTAGMIGPTGHLRQEKRVLVVGKSKGETMLDVTLGETSFERVARTGIAVVVEERFDEVRERGGVVGQRNRVYMIQMKSEAEAAYTFSLVGRLRY